MEGSSSCTRWSAAWIAWSRVSSTPRGYGPKGSRAPSVGVPYGQGVRLLRTDPWVVERPLGRGGQGAVFACTHRRDPGRRGALKFFDGGYDPRGLARFVAETQLLSALDHPGIVRVLDVRVDPEAAWYVMERVEGASLVGASGWDAAAVASLGTQLASALEHAHQQGIGHGDVKPGNVLLAEDGRAVLVDFGSAHRLDSVEGPRPVTPRYAPPEWVDGVGGLRLDPFGLGVLLYELLRGEAWPPETSASDVARGWLARGALDPGPAIPGPLREVVRDLTRARPDERLVDLARVRARLEVLDRPGALQGRVPTAHRSTQDRSGAAPRLEGRDALLEEARARLGRGGTLLLLGPPGVGKTALAEVLAAAHGGAAVFCDAGLAPELDELLALVGRRLGVPLADDEPVEQLGAVLANEAAPLLVLDQVEHLGPELDAVVQRWSQRGARLLLTSQREIQANLDSLSVPPLEPLAAVRLFLRISGAGHAPGQLDDIARVVRRLDGLPLAIELAAGQARLMSPALVLERLDRVVGGAGRFHDPLIQAIAQAWGQLPPDQRRALVGASVFAGRLGRGAATAVLGDEAVELLDGLASRSLVQAGPGGWRLLDAVAGFAASEGETAERLQAARRHAAWFAGLATARRLRAFRHAGRLGEAADLHVAVPELVRASQMPSEHRVALTLALGEVLVQTGPYEAASRRVQGVLEATPADHPRRGELEFLAGRIARVQGRLDEAQRWTEAALDRFQRLGRTDLVADALVELGFLHTKSGSLDRVEAALSALQQLPADRMEPGTRAMGRIVDCDLRFQRGASAELAPIYGEIIEESRTGGVPVVEAMARSNLGRLHVAGVEGDLRGHLRRAAELFQQLGFARNEGIVLDVLGNLCVSLGPVDEGARALAEAAQRFGRLGATGLRAVSEANLGTARALLGDLTGGIELKERSAREYQRRAWRWNEAINAGNTAVLLLRRDEPGDLELARSRVGRCVSLLEELGASVPAGSYRAVEAELDSMQGAHGPARATVVAALDVVRGAAPRQEVIKVLAMAARIHARAGDTESAKRLLAEARAEARALGLPWNSVAGVEVALAEALLVRL